MAECTMHKVVRFSIDGLTDEERHIILMALQTCSINKVHSSLPAGMDITKDQVNEILVQLCEDIEVQSK